MSHWVCKLVDYFSALPHPLPLPPLPSPPLPSPPPPTPPCSQELERQVEKLGQTQEKLRNTESEIHTLKSFLTSKTALVERRKRELQDTRMKVTQLEAKDSRRAVILADVLEKTARQYQKQLAASTTAAAGTLTTRTMSTPYSLMAGERCVQQI